MLIANPIYDVVFKRLMENERVAKFFIGTLLDQTIEMVTVQPQEFTYTDELAGLAVFRLDFIATIKTETGELKKVLIEIQKAKHQIDLMRKETHFNASIQKEDTLNNEKHILPITTIYILGFKLPEIDTPCIHVERNYKDLVNKKTLHTKNEFIEKLTHDSYVVQVDRISNQYSTALDKLLSVFEQTNFADDRKITKEYTHQTDLAEIQLITNILHHAGTNPAERKQIEDEQEAWRSVNAMFENDRKQYEKALEEKDMALEQMAKQLEELKRKFGEQ